MSIQNVTLIFLYNFIPHHLPYSSKSGKLTILLCHVKQTASVAQGLENCFLDSGMVKDTRNTIDRKLREFRLFIVHNIK